MAFMAVAGLFTLICVRLSRGFLETGGAVGGVVCTLLAIMGSGVVEVDCERGSV